MSEHIRVEAGFDRLEALLRNHSGMSFGAGLRERAVRAVRHTAARFGCASTDELVDLIKTDPSVLDRLIDEVTVGETYFFREPEQFEALRARVLPELIARRGPNHSVRAWSAGCASGEEPYSLAIVFAEEGLAERAFVLGTDISPAKLARARVGTYRQWSLRGDGVDNVRPYLEPEGESLRLVDAIRSLVTFRQVNLASDDFPSLQSGILEMDVVFCRNVLIYFDRETIERVVARLFATLAPGGWLFTAGADPMLSDFAPFVSVPGPFGPAYRRPLEVAGPVVSVPKSVAAEPPPLPEPLPPPERHLDPPPVRTPAARPDPTPAARPDPLDDARKAYSAGEYDRAVEIVSSRPDDEAASALRVRALANRDGSRAAAYAAHEAAIRHPLSVELHSLCASLLVDLGRDAEAAEAFRRALFLDKQLAVLHFALAMTLERLGDLGGARRGFRNALEICRGMDPDEPLPHGDGERAGSLGEIARACLERLDRPERTT